MHKLIQMHVQTQVGEENTRSNVLLELLSQILHEPCFDTLRTKEQLGAELDMTRSRFAVSYDLYHCRLHCSQWLEDS